MLAGGPSPSTNKPILFLLPLGQIPLSQRLRSPVYLALTFTGSISLSDYNTILWHHTMMPVGFLTMSACSCSDDQASEWYSTIRLLQFRVHLDCCRRALVILSYPILFFPQAVSPSHRLPLLAYLIPFWQPLCYSACIPYTRRTSTSLLDVTRSEMPPPAATAVAPR